MLPVADSTASRTRHTCAWYNDVTMQQADVTIVKRQSGSGSVGHCACGVLSCVFNCAGAIHDALAPSMGSRMIYFTHCAKKCVISHKYNIYYEVIEIIDFSNLLGSEYLDFSVFSCGKPHR